MKRKKTKRQTLANLRRLADLDRLERSESHGVGAISLDVQMARRHGWSLFQLERVVRQLGIISRRNSAISHRYGPPKGCPCEACDYRTPDDKLGQPSARRLRAAWRRRSIPCPLPWARDEEGGKP